MRRCPNATVLALVATPCLGLLGCATPKLQARADPRVELVSVVFRLAGNVEFNQPTARSPYSEAADQHFHAWREHAAVTQARELRGKNGVSFDAVVGLAVHLDNSFAVRGDLPSGARPERLDRRWPPDEVPRFVEALRDFARVSRFPDFLESQADRLNAAAARLTGYVSDHDIVPWFERYFGASRRARFGLVCGMLTGGCCYGTSVRLADGSEEITPVIGVWRWDEAGIPAFGPDVMPIIIHEFAHVYVNPAVEALLPELRPVGERLLAAARERMESMAYGGAEAVLYESLVRACVVRYRHHMEGVAAGREQLLAEWGSGFLWTDLLADCLADYERRRWQFRAFRDYMPRVRACLERIALEHARLAARFPAVVGFAPSATEEGIDPATTEIRLTFDRPMAAEGVSVTATAPQHAEWLGNPVWTNNGTVLTVPVSLTPGTQYEMVLNGGGRLGLCSQDGFPLLPTPISFNTSPRP